MGTHNPHGSSSMRIAKNSGLLYVRQLFVLFIALFTSRLTLQILGETDFGIYAAVGGVTAMLSVSVSAVIIFTVGLTRDERLFVSEALIKIRNKFL
ncbi:hypothetical protein [Phocaeicola massiliensis]|jgi:polysaccharide biosynthesis protein|uniref:hypothetical protein n=1 Tax=Phocaeicola massiliensis TaxID=204516 RepID=UPI00189888EB|nr:hypothetical protein [Phocaeicola massiliensis]